MALRIRSSFSTRSGLSCMCIVFFFHVFVHKFARAINFLIDRLNGPHTKRIQRKNQKIAFAVPFPSQKKFNSEKSRSDSDIRVLTTRKARMSPSRLPVSLGLCWHSCSNSNSFNEKVLLKAGNLRRGFRHRLKKTSQAVRPPGTQGTRASARTGARTCSHTRARAHGKHTQTTPEHTSSVEQVLKPS